MRAQYLPFADWLKALGLALIVWGHVAASTTVSWAPPIYPKQLGVAFFVFVTGFTLARERRDRTRVLYNRYFEVFLFGLLFALMMSAVGMVLWSDPNESNYLPLVFGLNVLMNDFPANPTTWYIGTYLHLLLFWALVLRGVRIRGWMLVVACASEIALRAILVETQGVYVAYMFLSNWLTVLFLGLAFGQRDARDERHRVPRTWAPVLMLILVWPLLMAFVGWKLTFPFMSLVDGDSAAGTLAVSAAVSFVYITYTLAAYRVTVSFPASAFVQFIARNTTVVFIAHMPVYYALEYMLLSNIQSYGPRVTIEFLVCLPGLAVVSEVIRRVVQPTVLRDRLAARLDRLLGLTLAASHGS
jgi:hypothetical protein